MQIAEVVAKRGTCLRRQVGCVLTNEAGHILATGYNGVPRGADHCNFELTTTTNAIIWPFACSAAKEESGSGLGACRAIHAEQNALLQCRDVEEIFACYTTVEPCEHCTKLLLNTGCQVVLYRQPYKGSGRYHWLEAGNDEDLWRVLTRP